MSARLYFLALPVIPALLLLVPLLPRDEDAASPPAAPMQDRADPGGILLRNESTGELEVELRSGAGGSCDTGRVLATQTVLPGSAWSIRSSQPLCYRRTDPGPGQRTRDWARKVTTRGQVEEVVL